MFNIDHWFHVEHLASLGVCDTSIYGAIQQKERGVGLLEVTVDIVRLVM